MLPMYYQAVRSLDFENRAENLCSVTWIQKNIYPGLPTSFTEMVFGIINIFVIFNKTPIPFF